MTSGGRHSAGFRFWAVASAALFCVIFASLGTWQVKRRAWKLDLISRVEERVHAPPTSLPDPARWPLITPQSDEYRHVSVDGLYLNRSQTLVQAVTEAGAGYWVMTPLRMADGHIVIVNRGFIPVDGRNKVAPARTGHVTGLIRMSEPGGAFLRHNRPAEDRWYSRDVHEISRVRGLTGVAPFFIDADADTDGNVHAGPDGAVAAAESAGLPGQAGLPGSGGGAGGSGLVGQAGLRVPLGGLTVVRFHNSHLVYAITWYTLALMAAGAGVMVIRDEAHT